MSCHPVAGAASFCDSAAQGFPFCGFSRTSSGRLRTLAITALFAAAVLAGAIDPANSTKVRAEMPIPERNAAQADREQARGSLVIMGGSERFDNRVIWSEIVKQAGGDGSRIAVFPTASGAPQVDGDDVVRILKEEGADAFLVPLAIRGLDTDYRDVVRDPAIVESVRQSQGVFFVGGEQARIRQALVTPEGENTPLLEAVWHVYRDGGVVAGTSAGAAVMSRIMFRSAQSVLNTMQHGVTMGREIDYGLGFLDPDWFVDQHCLVRGRFARALVAMHDQGFGFGFGIDEDTALVVAGDQARVIGYRGVLVFDLSDASSDPKLAPFNLKNARLSYLDRGDSIHLRTLRISPSPEKQAGRRVVPAAADFRPRFRQRPVFNDILGNMAVHDLMVKLVDNRSDEGLGLAFDGAAALAGPTAGFEFRFYRGDDSEAWQTEAFGGDDYTVANIHVDVSPVQLVGPLYTKR
ncbi:MAG: cyanophycinase [Pirellulales bacterium]